MVILAKNSLYNESNSLKYDNIKGPSPNYRLICLFIGLSVHRLWRDWLILIAAHKDPRPRKRETGADGFTRQWSLALSNNLETVPKQTKNCDSARYKIQFSSIFVVL